MFISKGSYAKWEPQNVILVSVKKAHLTARTFKILSFIHRRIGPTVGICGNSVLPLPMVPWLHQRNNYIKRKLPGWRPQKCNPSFSAKRPPRSTDLQIPILVHRPIKPPGRIFGNSGLPLAMVPWLHQRNIHMKRKLQEWSAQKCNPCFSAKSAPRSTELQDTRFQ